ncbi:MAG: FtsX-like permease family protein, partial [Spirochaetaceae bacterium]|nr:FtsX-like permease family protein [Spirochaetaceae bacterium]
KIEAELRAVLGDDVITNNNIHVTSWRDYNKAFFNALRTEKLLMFLLVGLIFVVVALNIYQSQRRTVLERSEEIGLMRAIGAEDISVRSVFALNGLFIGLIGATGGMLLALLIATHIEEFFAFIEAVITIVVHGVYMLTSGMFSDTSDFAVFSKRIFYIQEYTARLIVHEVVLIYLFAVFSAFLAAWFASRRISKIKPSEVLRYE